MALTRQMPELHGPVLALIGKVHTAHQSGSGPISLVEVVRSMGAELTPEDEAELAKRPDLVLTQQSGTGGAFKNVGQQIKRSQFGVKVTIPAVVQGNYTSSPQQFVLTFDGDHTIAGRLFPFTVKLKSIMANQQQVQVDCSGDIADITIVHG